MAITVALDAGHGGTDPGAQYNGRTEKDDVLELTRAVGNILKRNGIDVFYVRENDEYETPFKKATDANNSGADFFVSIHRNSSEYPNQYTGIQTLVYSDDGVRAQLARNINKGLKDIGFTNIGVDERPNLVVLRRTKMPSALVEVGFINSDSDNALFDNNFDEVANAIAQGILETLPPQTASHFITETSYATETANELNTENITTLTDNNYSAVDNYMPMTTQNYAPVTIVDYEDYPEKMYRVQVGAYKNKQNADRLLNSLLIEGFPAFMVYDDGYHKIQVGGFIHLANAVKMEQRLRRFRYNTFIVYD